MPMGPVSFVDLLLHTALGAESGSNAVKKISIYGISKIRWPLNVPIVIASFKYVRPYTRYNAKFGRAAVTKTSICGLFGRPNIPV